MMLLLGMSMAVQAAKPAKPASAANSQSAAALAALPIEEAVDLPPDASVPAAQVRHSPAVEVKGAASEAALSRTQAVIEQQIKDDKNSATAEEDPPHHGQRSAPALWFLRILAIILYVIVAFIMVYAVRHMAFTLNRLFGKQRHPYLDIETAEWPRVTVFIAAHNEEAVIADAMEALLESDYPDGRMIIMPVNDRSTDGTREIIDQIAARRPDIIRPSTAPRQAGQGGCAERRHGHDRHRYLHRVRCRLCTGARLAQTTGGTVFRPGSRGRDGARGAAQCRCQHADPHAGHGAGRGLSGRPASPDEHEAGAAIWRHRGWHPRCCAGKRGRLA
jgi:hypothetical protein